ncbi:hypothetical protein V6N13_065062 [Hibiscus sabdariffa]
MEIYGVVEKNWFNTQIVNTCHQSEEALIVTGKSLFIYNHRNGNAGASLNFGFSYMESLVALQTAGQG